MQRSWVRFGAVASGLLAACLVTTGLAQAATWTTLLGLTTIAIERGRRRHRPRDPLAWRLLSITTLGFAAALTAHVVLPPVGSGMHPVAGGLMVLAYPLLGVSAGRFARAQSDGCDRGPWLDSLIVTVACTAAMWEAALVRHARGALDTEAELLVILVTASLACWVAAMTMRVVFAGGYATFSGWTLAAASTAGGAAAVHLVSSGMPDGHLPRTTVVLWGVGLLLLGVAALHPSMARLTEPADVDTAHVIVRTVLPSLALFVCPLAVALRWRLDDSVAPVATIGSLAVCLAVAARFTLLVVDRERARDQLREQALRDPLTGLPNRVLFFDRLTVALDRRRRRGTQVWVLFVDLDGFKRLNDRHGHAIGDLALVEVGRRLSAASRASDTVARLGGDEFVLFTEVETTADARALTARLQDELCRPLVLPCGPTRLGASIGAVSADDVGNNPHALLSAADTAMYVVKRRRQMADRV
ncbi:GGDEF domain-containing protein [Egicoccus halophilus]|uniref:GGDEF domain-containing protein n=1 Tax=Egicoccus halophilus TaxID=1670830 RepID=A0A8J3A9I0_9ACTN|nr:GGDEF domain-containing protein [Egicoccus halophilus]GGI07736.1 hypothetical protein GCM10011354_25580 [Egicoccus halophilus]